MITFHHLNVWQIALGILLVVLAMRYGRRLFARVAERWRDPLPGFDYGEQCSDWDGDRQ